MVVLAVGLALTGLGIVRQRVPLGGRLLSGRTPALAPGRQIEYLGGRARLVALFGVFGEGGTGPVTGPTIGPAMEPIPGPNRGPIAGMRRRLGREGG